MVDRPSVIGAARGPCGLLRLAERRATLLPRSAARDDDWISTADPHMECLTGPNARYTAVGMEKNWRQPTAATPGKKEADARTSAARRAPSRRVVRPTLTEPEVVPMTPEQHDQVVAALAMMIGDWMRARLAARRAGPRDG
jgi:hypothetical protein